MQIRDWFRPQRYVLALFLAVALVSGTTLAALAWMFVRQDQVLELQRRQERIEQAADRSAAVMTRSLADLELLLAAQPGPDPKLPPDVVILSAGPAGITVSSDGGLLYYPAVPGGSEEPRQAFEEGERLEFAKQDPQGAPGRHSPAPGRDRGRDEGAGAVAILKIASSI
jgi:hypothetical protein